MRSKRITPDEQLKLIMECHQSGLSDYQWCQMHDVNPGTFYNWINRFRKRGIAIPAEPALTGKTGEPLQEVVKLDLFQNPTSAPAPIPAAKELPAVEILIGSATVHFFNSTNRTLIEATLECLGGAIHAR